MKSGQPPSGAESGKQRRLRGLEGQSPGGGTSWTRQIFLYGGNLLCYVLALGSARCWVTIAGHRRFSDVLELVIKVGRDGGTICRSGN